MSVLLLGLFLFFIPHLVREVGMRDKVVELTGSVGAYKGLYSLVSAVGLGLIIWGKAIAPFVMIWEPYYELRFISLMLMIPAWILFFAGNVPNSYIREGLRHPMLAGVALWGLAHLWSNGDLASILLFGSFAVWAAFKFVSLSLSTASTGKKPSIVWDAIALAGGVMSYIVIFTYHGQIFGVGLSFA